MRVSFWLCWFLSFLLVNEYLSEFFLAMFVGKHSVVKSWHIISSPFVFDSYLFSAMFRAIPYVMIAFIVITTGLKTTVHGKTALWFALITIAVIHFWGYWDMQHSFYTPARTSSTAGLAVIFIPIHAIWLSGIGGIIGYTLSLARQKLTITPK